jgi:RNA polymerase sigma-70 factor (ECF subfamily)
LLAAGANLQLLDGQPDEQRAIADTALWRRLQTGDADAFGELFERYATSIYNYCFRRVGDWATAEDLTSIVFLEAWRRRSKDLQPGTVRPWLYGIAVNVIRNRRRSERRYRSALQRVTLERLEADFADEIEQRLTDETQMKRVLRLVEELPRREQEILSLCVWSGLTYDETSAALGIPVGTVRSRLARARTRLRELEGVTGHSEGARVDALIEGEHHD